MRCLFLFNFGGESRIDFVVGFFFSFLLTNLCQATSQSHGQEVWFPVLAI